MSKKSGRGVFVLSLDVREESQRLQTQVAQVLRALRRHHIPATWAFPQPGHSAIAMQLAREPLVHEAAILGDPSWVGEQVGRTTFARELACRVESAAASGLHPRTLALQRAELEDNLDLLVKHRISFVRSATRPGFRPRSLRFGVWQAPVSFSLPAENRWSFGGQEWAIGRALTRASKSHDIVHVVVDLQRLGQHNQTAALERVLTGVQRRQSKGIIAALTLSGVADLLAPRSRPAAARSVLHAA